MTWLALQPRSFHRWWLVLLAASAVLGAMSWLAYVCWRDPGVPFLSEHGPAQWIVYPSPFQLHVRPAMEMGGAFRKRFELDAVPAEATLSVRAFRRCEVRLNGQRVALGEAANWKQEARADVVALLREGENEIFAVVLNQYGPPALWLALIHSGGRVVSDADWVASLAGATPRPAVAASDPARRQIRDPFRNAPTLATSLERSGPVLGVWALVAAGMLTAFRCRKALPRLRTRDDAWVWSRLNLGLLAATAALWIALVVHNDWWQRRTAGFDAPDHLAYIERVQTQAGLPLADQGSQMFQPPLYYWLSAAALGLTGRSVGDPGDLTVVRTTNLLIVLIGLLLVWKSLRLIFLAHPQRAALGFLVAAMLPMQLSLHHYPTNEILAGTLGSALIYTALRVLQNETAGPWRHALLGIVMGLALLAKSSLLVVAAAVGLALLIRLLLDARAGGWRRGVVHLGLTLAVCLAVSGWYYAVVWAHFGKPLVANFDPIFRWWQDPGYSMAADYSRFGRSFSSPLYSSTSSLWDGYYTTLWGDGACSGAGLAVFCPPWSYELMTLGYWLAIVPMLGIVVGALAMLIAFARQPMPWVLVGAVVGGTLLAMLALVTTVPRYCHVKSSYALMALVPLAALAGWGLDLMSGPQRWRRGIVWFAVLTWALNAYATFWVQDRASTRAVMGAAWLADGDARGLAELQAALERDERQPLARLFLAETLLREPGRRPQARKLLALAPNQVDTAPRQMLLATLYGQSQEVLRAEAALREAIRLDPDYLLARRQLAALSMRRSPAAGIEAYREVLRIDPLDAEAHRRLVDLYGSLGQIDGVALHQNYLEQLAQQEPAVPPAALSPRRGP